MMSGLSVNRYQYCVMTANCFATLIFDQSPREPVRKQQARCGRTNKINPPVVAVTSRHIVDELEDHQKSDLIRGQYSTIASAQTRFTVSLYHKQKIDNELGQLAL